MSQPKFSPIAQSAEVRQSYHLGAPQPWCFSRPAELSRDYSHSYRSGMGDTGPDQGFAIKLAKKISDRIVLAKNEDLHDVLAGMVAIALRRASLFGRAPVISDVLLAGKLFGYLGEAREELLGYRKELFSGIAHDKYKERILVASIPENALVADPKVVVDILGRLDNLSSVTTS